MIGDIPIVSFDTSSHNRLVKDGSLSEPILAGLKSGFAFRFVGLSIDEMVATADPVKRYRTLRLLLTNSRRCQRMYLSAQ